MILGLFIALIIVGMVFLFYAFLRMENEFYLDTIAAFLSSIIFFIVGFTAYGGIQFETKSIQYPVLGLLFVVIGVIASLLGFMQIIDIAIDEFSWGDDETKRDETYEYK